MLSNLIDISILIVPISFVLVAVVSWFKPGLRPTIVKNSAKLAAYFGILIAIFASGFVWQNGIHETAFFGYNEIGFRLRLDAVSLIMFTMISIIAFIVIRYSERYLDGDPRQGVFIGRLAATLASVQLLVLAGNIGVLFVSWVLTSVFLNRLLIFYKERPGAIIAARKKFIVARLADVCLLFALYHVYLVFGTGDLGQLFEMIRTVPLSDLSGYEIETAALLFASAALLKSAQFPSHGWLIEVMETPTPVSALLHAGLLNAGPFLIIRLSFIIDVSVYAPIVLMIIGGFTAVFASIIFMTQTSIKTTLAYSSIAHMGFSLLTCGMGVYSAALLHLVAHSFYKAHAFLASGSVIETLKATKIIGVQRKGNTLRILAGILLGMLTYVGFAMLWGVDTQEQVSLLFIGGIIVLGLSNIFTNALDSNGSITLVLRSSLFACIVTGSFFLLESGSHFLIANEVPPLHVPSFTEMTIAMTLLTIFTTVVFIQLMAAKLQTKPFYQAIAIHFRNDLYVNTLFDRVVGALYAHDHQKYHALLDEFNDQKDQKMALKEYRKAVSGQ